jgi:hypothetical protein
MILTGYDLKKASLPWDGFLNLLRLQFTNPINQDACNRLTFVALKSKRASTTGAFPSSRLGESPYCLPHAQS